MELLHSELSALMYLLIRKVEKVYRKHRIELPFSPQHQHTLLMAMFSPGRKKMQSDYLEEHLHTFSNISISGISEDSKSLSEVNESAWTFPSLVSQKEEPSYQQGDDLVYGTRGSPPRYLAMEEQLKKWVIEKIQNGEKINKNMLRAEAIRISDCPQFHASRGWLRCFLRRYPVIRQKLEMRRQQALQQKKNPAQKKQYQVPLPKDPYCRQKIKSTMYQILEEMIMEESDTNEEEVKKEAANPEVKEQAKSEEQLSEGNASEQEEGKLEVF